MYDLGSAKLNIILCFIHVREGSDLGKRDNGSAAAWATFLNHEHEYVEAD
jgi:hypothetical protein